MQYEIVNLEEKSVAGLKIRSSNDDVNMTKAIGDVWQKFFAEGFYQSISNKKNDYSIGLYTNYEFTGNVMSAAYDMMVCCEISETENLPMGVDAKVIPAGKYAKFVVHGDVKEAVSEFWTKLWSMNLDRKYSCDFEEYHSGCEMHNAEIHIYISLK